MNNLLLNCDIGESFGAWRMGLDAEVMPLIDCANIACGFHAGDPGTMRRTVALAVEHGVRIGAHPGYPDLVGFGRRSLACSAQEVEDLLLYQIGALDGLCRAQGTRVRYVKPHGALYQDMMRDPAILAAVLRALAAYDRTLPLMLMSTRDNTAARAGRGPRHRAVVRGVRRPRLRRRRLPGLAQPARRGTPRRRDGARPGPPAGPWRGAASQRRQRPGAGGADPLRTRRQPRLAGCGAAHPRRPGGGMSQPQPRIEVAAIDSFVLRLFERIDEANMPWLLAAEENLRAAFGAALLDLVPSYTTLLLQYDLLQLDPGEARARIAAALSDLHPRRQDGGRLHILPTWYDPRVGPDLEPLARRKQLGVAELIRRHSQREYRVFALGFSPGFAFMGLVEEALAAPRLATPRQRIAAGSVGIAERQTAVYPQASPGGWNLLGRCPVRLFDLTLDGYSLLRAGDRVRFEPIGHAEFVRLGGDDTPLEVQA